MNIASRDDQPQGSPPWSDQRITAFVLGELDAEEAARFAQEIGDQPELASAVEEAQQLTAQLRSWYAVEPSPPLDAPRRQRLFSAMAQAPSRSTTQAPSTPQAQPAPPSTTPSAMPSGSRRTGPLVRWLALAATLLVAIGGLTYPWLRPGDEAAREIALAPRQPADDAAEPAAGDAAAPPAAAKANGAASPGEAAGANRRFSADDPAVLGVETPQAARAAPQGRTALAPPPMTMRAAALPQAAADAMSSSPEPPFQAVSEQPHSRIPADVDPAAAATVREALAQGRLPRPEEVRIESLINALSGPVAEQSSLVEIETGPCPWRPEHRLARIAIQRNADDDDFTSVLSEGEVAFHVAFNPAQVASYRLIGFEDQSPVTLLSADDSQPSSSSQAAAAAPERASAQVLSLPKDSDQAQRARRVIVLYQWVPRQQRSSAAAPASEQTGEITGADNMLTVQLRRGDRDEATVLAEFPATGAATDAVGQGSVPYRSTALIAALGLQLRQSEFRGNWTLQDVLHEALQLAAELDTPPPWLELVQTAAALQADQAAGQAAGQAADQQR